MKTFSTKVTWLRFGRQTCFSSIALSSVLSPGPQVPGGVWAEGERQPPPSAATGNLRLQHPVQALLWRPVLCQALPHRHPPRADHAAAGGGRGPPGDGPGQGDGAPHSGPAGALRGEGLRGLQAASAGSRGGQRGQAGRPGQQVHRLPEAEHVLLPAQSALDCLPDVQDAVVRRAPGGGWGAHHVHRPAADLLHLPSHSEPWAVWHHFGCAHQRSGPL